MLQTKTYKVIINCPRTILPPHTPHFIYFNPADTLTGLQSGHRISPSPVRLTEAAGNAASTPGSCLTDPEVNIRQENKTGPYRWLFKIQVCEFDESSYPTALVDSVLSTFHQEMRTLLKYIKPSMIRVSNKE